MSALFAAEQTEGIPQAEWRKALQLTLEPLPVIDGEKKLGVQKEKFTISYKKLVDQQTLLQKQYAALERTDQARKLLQVLVKTDPTKKLTAQQKAEQEAYLKAFKFKNIEEAKPFLDNLEREAQADMENLRIAVIGNMAVFLAQRAEFINKHNPGMQKEAVPDFLVEYLPLSSKELGLLKYSRIVLKMQHRLARKLELPSSPSVIAGDADYLMTIALKKHLSVGAALEFADPAKQDAAVTRFLKECGYAGENNPQFINAAKLILGYLSQYAPSINSAAQLEGIPVESLTIAEALELAGGESMVMKFADRFIESGAKLNVGDLEGIIKESFEDLAKNKDVSVQKVLLPSSKYGKKLQEARATNPDAKPQDIMTERELEQYTIDAQKVMEFMLDTANAKVPVRQIDLGYLALVSKNEREAVGGVKGGPKLKNTLFPQQQEMVVNICTDVQSQQTYDLCVSALQDKPNGMLDAATGWIGDRLIGSLNDKTAAALKGLILEGKMGMKDAFELYYILHSAEASGNKVGSFTLTMKVLSLLKNNGHAGIAAEWNSVITADLLTAAMKGSTNIVQILRQYGLNDKQLEEMEDVVATLQEQGLGYAEGAVTQTIRFWAKNPVWATILGAVLGTGTVAAALRVGPLVLDNWGYRGSLLKRFAFATDLSAMAQNLNMSVGDLQAFQAKVKEFYVDRKNFTVNLPARNQRLRLANTFRRNAGKLNDLAKALYTKPSTSVGGRVVQSLNSRLGRTYYTHVDDVTRHLLSVSPDNEEAVRDALKGIVSETEADASLERVRNQAPDSEEKIQADLEALEQRMQALRRKKTVGDSAATVEGAVQSGAEAQVDTKTGEDVKPTTDTDTDVKGGKKG